MFLQSEEILDHCSFITDKSLVFAQCSPFVEPEPYKELCLIDFCSCEANPNTTQEHCMESLCGAALQYSRECVHSGVVLNWRNPHFCRKFKFMFIGALEGYLSGCFRLFVPNLWEVARIYELFHSMTSS